MLSSTYGTNYTASGGVWQNSRNNPRLTAHCAVDVALVLDMSASVGSALPDLKAATDTFTDALAGTPSRMAVFSFDQASPATSVTDVSARRAVSRRGSAGPGRAHGAGGRA